MPKKLDLSQRSLAEHGMVKRRDTLDSDSCPRGKMGTSSANEENPSQPVVISPPIQELRTAYTTRPYAPSPTISSSL